MPSGRTHDLITLALVPLAAGVAYYSTANWKVAAIVAAGLIFGGLMFGPDLDIYSRQYERWGPLKGLWWPYRMPFAQRSLWSHSILFGTLIRVIYFLVVVTLGLAITLYARHAYIHRAGNGIAELNGAVARVWEALAPIKRSYLIAGFLGLWLGASSHTAADVLGSFFKSVRKSI